jgi:effector-binding domain-containing protein
LLRAEPGARGFQGNSMTCPWRAIVLAAALALGAAPLAFAQPAAPPPAATPDPPPPPPPPAPSRQSSTDPFGEELVLTPKTIIYLKGQSTWDNALESLIDAFKSVYAFLDKQGLKRAGPSMTIYTQADDTGFQFQAAVPIDQEPKDPPKGDVALGKSPGGRALKFVHRGSYDSMDSTYEAITNHLDEKRLEAEEVFVEEYETDPVTTAEDKFVITVFVPIK